MSVIKASISIQGTFGQWRYLQPDEQEHCSSGLFTHLEAGLQQWPGAGNLAGAERREGSQLTGTDVEDSSPAELITFIPAHKAVRSVPAASPTTSSAALSTACPRPRCAPSPVTAYTRVFSASGCSLGDLLLGSLLYLTNFSSPPGVHQGSSKKPSLTSYDWVRWSPVLPQSSMCWEDYVTTGT